MTKTLNSLDRWLLSSHHRVTDPEKIQRSRLLSIILLVQVMVIILIIVLVLQADPEDIHEPTVQGAMLMIGISAGVYVLNRFGYTSIAALIFFLVFVALFIYIPFYSGENPAFLAFLVIPLLFIAIFFSVQRTLIASIGILTLVGILLSFLENSPQNLLYWNLRNMWYFLMLVTVLVLTFMRHLNNMEQIRRHELKRINQDLQQKIAELERFTYTISHELKTPIVTIKNYVGSVNKDLKEENYKRVHKDLERISSAADKLQNSIQDLLELTRIGRVTNPSENVDPNQLVHDLLKTMESQIRSGNVDVQVAPNLPTIYGDKHRLREVFENLISNAIKYMGDQASPVIEIGVINRDSQRVFFVKDNGMGVEEQYKEKIFGLFEKLDATIEGTGIGLTLVKRIIETYGGKIWVESEGLGKGAMFCFTISDNKSTNE